MPSTQTHGLRDRRGRQGGSQREGWKREESLIGTTFQKPVQNGAHGEEGGAHTVSLYLCVVHLIHAWLTFPIIYTPIVAVGRFPSGSVISVFCL